MIGLEEQTFNAVMNYLTSRPYKEVCHIIDEIQNTAKQIKVEEKSEDE